MQIDWWTLALQTINVLILVWILARFFFRPVREIVAKRQEEAARVLADAEAERGKAEAARANAEKASAEVAAGREAAILAAHNAAEEERARLLKQASEEVARLHTDGEQALVRERAALEGALIDRARDLSIEVARRLLGRISPEAGLQAFLDDLCKSVRSATPQLQAALVADGTLEVTTAAALPDDRSAVVRRALQEALGRPVQLTFHSDPKVVAGIELSSAHAAIRSSWREDLERIRKELAVGDGSA